MRTLVAPLLVGFLFCAGCGSGPGEGGANPAVPAGADPLQAEILADGNVSDGELERALRADVACVRERGFEASLDVFDPAAGRIEQTASAPNGDIAGLQRANEQCEAKYLSAVQVRYNALHAPTQEQDRSRLNAFIACLADRGFDVKGLDYIQIGEKVPHPDYAACDH
jgi:hypothetical protein